MEAETTLEATEMLLEQDDGGLDGEEGIQVAVCEAVKFQISSAGTDTTVC